MCLHGNTLIFFLGFLFGAFLCAAYFAYTQDDEQKSQSDQNVVTKFFMELLFKTASVIK